jgi:hypothetical protein
VIRSTVAAGILLLAGVGFVYWRAMAPRVVAVHPELSAVPANLLRLYVDFSQPMAGDDAFEHVRLLDASGRPIPDAFREIELWSRDNRRLMAYVHPGRVKSGLAIGEQFGPVLEEGKTYTLEVLPGMKSRSGRPLQERVARSLTVGPPDQRPPDLARWTLSPRPDRLDIVCDEWLDHAGLEDFVRVEGVPGRCRVDGLRVTFTPERRFAAGEYRLAVDARLEDLAGNNFIKPFETPSGATPLPSERPAMLVRSFRVPARE